jgi:leucyl-tRNA synthetase
LLRPTDNETDRLDFYFAEFASKATKLLNEYRFKDYITLIKNFSMQYVIREIPSNDNILTFIRTIFPILPYLAEEVYEEKFKSRYSIINEGWPGQ